MTKLEHLAQLAREIRAVIPGAKSVAIYSTGDMLVQVVSDDAVRAFAAEHGVVVNPVDTETSRWIDARAVIDGAEIDVMGPVTDLEQTTEAA